MLSAEDRELWNFILVQDSIMLQQFGTAVIGMGALFFAYGQIFPLNVPYLKVKIAPGLGYPLR